MLCFLRHASSPRYSCCAFPVTAQLGNVMDSAAGGRAIANHYDVLCCAIRFFLSVFPLFLSGLDFAGGELGEFGDLSSVCRKFGNELDFVFGISEKTGPLRWTW